MWKFALCLPFCLAANWIDWKTYKIPNRLVVALMLTGLMIQSVTAGPPGAVAWFMGLLPAFLLLPFFALRMLGAGDIKLLSALGGLLGIHIAFLLIAFSIVVSGVIGIVVLFVRGSFSARFRVLWQYLKSCLLLRTILPYTSGNKDAESDGKFAFSFGITGGLLLAAWCCKTSI